MEREMFIMIMIFKIVGALAFGIMAYKIGREAAKEDSFGLCYLCVAFLFLAGACVMYGSKELPVSFETIGIQVEQTQEVEELVESNSDIFEIDEEERSSESIIQEMALEQEEFTK